MCRVQCPLLLAGDYRIRSVQYFICIQILSTELQLISKLFSFDFISNFKKSHGQNCVSQLDTNLGSESR